jgi:Zn-dependent protease with chaperone function
MMRERAARLPKSPAVPTVAEPNREPVDLKLAGQVRRWARGGYLLLPGLAFLLLAITASLTPLSFTGRNPIWFALAVALLGFPAIQILLALRFKAPEPDGHRVTAADAPELFEAIEAARATLDAPPIHAVYVDDSFNAGALERPVRGVFGGWQRELIIGLPLMMSLSPQELTGVIGHELGHFAGAHGRRHRQVMRTHMAWAETMGRLSSMRFGGVTFSLLAIIGNWYVPRLMSMASGLARNDEFEADRAEAAVVGEAVAGAAHVRIQVAGKFLKCIVEEYHAANTTGDLPEMRLYALMAETLPHAVMWPDANAALGVALNEKTDTYDQHPCVAERLAALGCGADMPEDLNEDATWLLGEDLRGALIAGFDDMWWSEHAETWVVQGARNRRLALLEQAASDNCGPMLRLSAEDADIDDAMLGVQVA